MDQNVAYLTADIGRLFRKRLDCLARPNGLTGTQMRVLIYLNRFPGSNQVALAGYFEVEPITAGRMVDRMVSAGLVERRADPNDRRAWLVYATDKGRELLKELRGEFDANVKSALCGLDESERRTLENLLGQVRQNLLDQMEEPEVVNG
ncbi:MarR family winged helix-turn-helix transcriptional regulator [Croceicoccus bisphenolivorans]|uniref:MarR family winged helix-turn-helix transcriptional regulator n=1 Tax=Croceicoccus bisphenolivorans TaxID=1783232 RepID=UPI00082AE9BC|nr:MarR family winged helix-turn-helix transcriptional regulator [Croceicoccus bisphenolivorans]